MSKRALSLESGKIALSLLVLRENITEWLVEGEYQNHSPRPVEVRRLFTENLIWYLEREKCTECGTLQLKQFMRYLAHGHEDPGGLWGKPRLTKPLSSASIKDYYLTIKTCFRFEAGLRRNDPTRRIIEARANM